MILELICVAFVILVIKDYLKKIYINKVLEANGVKGNPLTLPILGDTLSIMGLNLRNSIQFMESLKLQYGKVCRLWCFNKCILIIQDVKYFEAILSSSKLIKKAFIYNKIVLWLGDGLVMSSGIKWQQHRKIVEPAFHKKMLEQFVEVFNQQAKVMVDKLHQKADGSSAIDITYMACATTLNVLLEIAMGVKINEKSNKGLAYVKALESLSRLAAERIINSFKHNDVIYKLLFFKTYSSFKKYAQILHEFTEEVIEKRRSELLKKAKTTEDDLTDLSIKGRFTFLDILLQSTKAEKPLTNQEIREEVDTFTFGGHDTVTIALSHILYLISRHPHVQENLFKEILNLIGTEKNQPITMQELQNLKYLECVIKEAMRLYPPAPVIGRKTEEEFKFGDIVIPRDTNLMLLIYAIARDSDYFPRPNDFIPERFSFHNKENINPYAFVPFSAGPRSCIGQKYAILEIKTIVCYMLRNFELLPLGPEVNRFITLVLRSTTGVHLGLKPRIY